MDSKKVYDLFIIGGGINGCGVAADAAGRGLNVYLAEQNDLASGTSSASSKLIHGGLRYLEHYEFRLVKEALAEREVLLSKAPHLVSPLKFTLPHRPHLRPSWMIRAGLFMYDHLSKRNSLPSAKSVPLGMAAGLKPDIQKGFEYYDCWVDDARLVVNNAIDAAERGATIKTGVRCEAANYVKEKQQWVISCTNLADGDSYKVHAKHIINAAGPWMRRVIDKGVPQLKASRGIRLIKGSHLIVPRVPNGDSAYILQNEDRRIV
ncbi:glycerol-3-phosphate dehydrogenase, partial [Oleiphilus sp. HI0080]